MDNEKKTTECEKEKNSTILSNNEDNKNIRLFNSEENIELPKKKTSSFAITSNRSNTKGLFERIFEYYNNENILRTSNLAGSDIFDHEEDDLAKKIVDEGAGPEVIASITNNQIISQDMTDENTTYQ